MMYDERMMGDDDERPMAAARGHQGETRFTVMAINAVRQSHVRCVTCAAVGDLFVCPRLLCSTILCLSITIKICFKTN